MLKYKMFYLVTIAILILFSSCVQKNEVSNNIPYEIPGLEFKERAELLYADKFTIDRYSDGYSMISVEDGNRYLIIPGDKSKPEKLDSDIKIIHQSPDNIYLAATSAMGLIDAIGCGESIKFSCTTADNWYIDYARNAMNNGIMLYAGKYREPDYELLISGNCKLSIQSTMIRHCPDVKEKLEELGITVFVDCSSFESHPLGRSEWIKVYGEIFGLSEEAESIYANETKNILKDGYESTGKTAAFFYISNSGQVVTRRPGDYITKMLELAGGENILNDIGDENSSGSVTMEMEKFYETAKDADFIIYNCYIGGQINSIDELISKNELLSDFKAVKNKNVWCTKNNLFQESIKLGYVIQDFNRIFTGKFSDEPPQYLYKLESMVSNK